MIETETPMDEIVMIETQTSVVSDVSDTKQLHTHTQPQNWLSKTFTRTRRTTAQFVFRIIGR